jgi:DNA topoisomerase-3
MEESEVRELVTKGVVGPLDGFVSAKNRRRFSASLRLVKDAETGKWKTELDFGDKADLDTLTPFWTDPRTGAELCEAGNNYLLRERADSGWKQAFRVGRIMCQKPLAREHAIQLIERGRTDLIQGFISRKGRPFDAFLKREDGRVIWEFPPRAPRLDKNGQPIARKAKIPPDLSKAVPVGESRLLGGEILQTADAYYVRKSGKAGRIVFTLKRHLCQKELPVGEVRQLLETGRTDLIDGFISKRATPFSAFLVLSKNRARAEFEFPPR